MTEPPRQFWTVGELAAAIRGNLEREFPEVRVAGEINGVARPASGHVYFTLKDEKAAIRCVLYRHLRRYLRLEPEDGKEFIVRGKVSAYEKRSEFQIIVDYLEPVGLGALHAAFLELQQKLAARGYFAQERKRPLPRLPRTIGIVTSTSGAALHDMLKIILQRRPNQHVVISPTLVQGEGAAKAIAAALDLLVKQANPDVVIVGRGGGSPEDLWCWNEEEVVHAVATCPVPVISAVGHEVDVTLCDLAADARAATPTHAAELAVAQVAELSEAIERLRRRAERAAQRAVDARAERMRRAERDLRLAGVPTTEFARRLDELHDRLGRTAGRLTEMRAQRVERLAARLWRAVPYRLVYERWRRADRLLFDLRAAAHRRVHRERLAWQGRRHRLERLESRLQRAMAAQLDIRQRALETAQVRIEEKSPVAVLARGYAIVTDEAGRTVKDAGQTPVGSAIGVRLHRGRLGAKVVEAEGGGGGEV